MRVVVSSSLFNVVSLLPYSSGGKLLIVLLCYNVASLLWKTVLHKLLLPVWVACMGFSPSDNWVLRHRFLSESCTSHGAAACSGVSSFTGCRWNSSHHWSLRTARDQPTISPCAKQEHLLWCASPFPSSLTFVTACFSLPGPSPLSTKRTLKTAECTWQVFPLKSVTAKALTGLALIRGRCNLELGKLWNFLQGPCQ